MKSTGLGVQLSLPTDPVTEGRFFDVKVGCDGCKATAVKGTFQGRTLNFYPVGEGEYAALVGVEVDYKAGPTPFEVEVITDAASGKASGTVEVQAGEFPSETLTVQPRKVRPLKRDMPRIRKERRLIAAAYAATKKERFWDPPLTMPIDSEITSLFGSKRVYNGVKQSAHYGTDLRAKTGTAVKAPLAGRVALAKDLFFTGNTVILDHGYGFFTIYGHLSRLKVKNGAAVNKGQVLGLSGATGRVSGPHLHWGAQLHGVKIDPMALKDLK